MFLIRWGQRHMYHTIAFNDCPYKKQLSSLDSKTTANAEITIYYSHVFTPTLFLETSLLKTKDINDGEERKVKSLPGNRDITMAKSSRNGNTTIVLSPIVAKSAGFRLNIPK